jgi:hypothetical protein
LFTCLFGHLSCWGVFCCHSFTFFLLIAGIHLSRFLTLGIFDYYRAKCGDQQADTGAIVGQPRLEVAHEMGRGARTLELGRRPLVDFESLFLLGGSWAQQWKTKKREEHFRPGAKCWPWTWNKGIGGLYCWGSLVGERGSMRVHGCGKMKWVLQTKWVKRREMGIL